MKIFWSWQSDTAQGTGRHFVRDVLAELAKNLNGLDGAEDAERPDNDELDEQASGDPLYPDTRIEVDHDTQGLGGSPKVAEAILRKIREAGVFVADVTLVAKTPKGKSVPNPNVMIELGYAMHVLDEQQIVLVMNSTEGGAPSKLPFDLKHWRWPILYRLHKDATDEQKAAEAGQLREALRESILPGLAIAKTRQTEARRRADRQPELRLRVEGEDLVQQISQTVQKIDAKPLADIIVATPELPLPKPPAPSGLIPTLHHPRYASILSSVGHVKPVAQWSREETEGYNSLVRSYYARYGKYLEEQEAFQQLVQRSFKVELYLDNVGTAPATAIDVDVHFPPQVTLYGDDLAFAPSPKVPEAPKLRPFGPGQAYARPVPMSFPDLHRQIMPRASYVHAEARRIHLTRDELKHNQVTAFEPFYLSFTRPEDIGPFEAHYVISAREPIDEIKGVIAFRFSRIDCRSPHSE